VVVHYLNIKNITVLPAKTDSPLIVNADTVLAFAIALQGFEPIAGRGSWVRQESAPGEETEACTGYPARWPGTVARPDRWTMLRFGGRGRIESLPFRALCVA